MDHYRHEMKYKCNEGNIVDIRSRLSVLAETDTYAIDGRYDIRSLYFDNYDNSAFYDNEYGVDPREKWRIRIYNGDSKRISLECKRKECGKISKKSDIISVHEYYEIINDEVDLCFDDRKVFNRFKVLKETMRLRPAVIVQYTRYPYVCSEGNVRVTLDCDISSSFDYNHFFDDSLDVRPIQSGNQQLLEVKYDELIPDEVYRALSLKKMQIETFSKYYLCRKYNMGVLL